MPLFDNQSSISDDLSDAICRLSTGGGMVLRTLFTDSDETVLTALRPVGLSGITEIVTRADLMDRCVFALTQEITEYIEEKVLFAKVDALAPSLLGALLDVVVSILRKAEDPTPLTAPWRMIDFVRWVSYLGEEALGWQEGEFAQAYAANRENAVLMIIEANPLASAIVAFMQETFFADGKKTTRKREPWAAGAATDLHPVLVNLAGSWAALQVPTWPRSPGMPSAKRCHRDHPTTEGDRRIPLQVTTHRSARPSGRSRKNWRGRGHAQGCACGAAARNPRRRTQRSRTIRPRTRLLWLAPVWRRLTLR